MKEKIYKPVILIVEDDAIIALDLKRMLSNFSYEPLGPVARGDLVVPFLEDHPADLVLMDILLEGGTDGVEAAARVIERFDIPVVYATAQSDDVTIERAMKTSPYGFIVKPFNDREIHGTIRSVLMRHSLEKAVRESERREKRSNRALRVMTAMGRSVIVSDSEDTYLDKICSSIVTAGGFRGAWIGYGKVGGTGGVIPVAKCGDISSPHEGKGSTLLLDLSVDSRTRGVITIIALDSDPFSPDEQSLFGGVCSDVEHGIRYFRFKSEKDRSESEIRYLHGFYKSVLDSIADAILVTESDGTVAYLNTAMGRLWSRNRADMIGKRIPEGLPDSVKENFSPVFERARATLSRISYDDLHLSIDGEDRIFSGVFIPRSKEGSYDGMICSFRDETHAHKAAEMSERYALLSEHARDAIFFVRPSDGIIIETNSAVCDIYGRTKEEFCGTSLLDLRAEDAWGTINADLKKADGEGVRFETMHRRKDGSVFPVEVNARSADLGGERIIISIVREVSERRALLKEFVASVDDVERSAGLALRNDLGGMLGSLSSALREKNDSLTFQAEQAFGLAAAIASDLAPVPWGEHGLRDVLQSFAGETEKNSSVQCQVLDVIPVSNYFCAANLFQITKEAVSNAVRHGRASIIEISVAESGSDAVLTVRNNGSPIEGSGVEGIGLAVMNCRAALCGGRVVFSLDETGWTCLTCRVNREGKDR